MRALICLSVYLPGPADLTGGELDIGIRIGRRDRKTAATGPEKVVNKSHVQG